MPGVWRVTQSDAGQAERTAYAAAGAANPPELADLRAEADALRAQWEAERQALRRVQALREEMEQVRQEAEQAERSYDLNRAAEL